MQKNWYIIYTKVKREKKVALTFTKKRIENFIPLNSKLITSGRRRKLVQQPLFASCLFVKVQEHEIEKIKRIEGVVNLLYWKQKPAIVSKEEIEVMKEFTSDYQDLILEKIAVDINTMAKIMDGSKCSIEGNVLTVKNTIVKVSLPSIGYTMVAKVETENALHTEVSFTKKDLLLQ